VWQDKSVPVVEDDPGIREVLSAALGLELGAYTVVAEDGVEALE
jgi:CheY-like chemotaxis protein